ncbi:sigma factor, partial [Enterococcus faecium]|uniref:sigma factor n=1 Tax=Enterococcus faecium TaxID=1352 RepID=UPI003F439C11
MSELLRRIASQDETALSELYDATVSRLFSLARAILRNPADAEEVVVDTFTQIWQTAARFDASRGSVMGWAMTICR